MSTSFPIHREGNDSSFQPAISAGGRFVAFWSIASNLVAGDTNGFDDIFVRDRKTGTTERVSLKGAGVQANGDSENPAISVDGRFVGFVSRADNLLAGDANSVRDVFLRDRKTNTTSRVSVAKDGSEGDRDSSFFTPPAISANGRLVAFGSTATNLVPPQDTTGWSDVFVRVRAP